MNQLQTLLSHLPDDKIQELSTVTDRIQKTAKAHVVILFGSYARGDYKLESGQERGKKRDYDLLVITADSDSRRAISLELTKVFDDIATPVQLVVETISTVNANLSERQFFFSDIRREGIVLHNSGQYTLAEAAVISREQRRKMAEDDFKTWFKQAKVAFEDYQNNYSKISNDPVYTLKCSFHLQQAVEMCYTTIEMVFAHYNPHEHNLYTLRQRAEAFDQQVDEAFPLNTEQETELFEYLNFAYIGGRYRSEEEFPVTTTQLDYWATETKKLLDLTEKICTDKIMSL